MNPRYPGFQRAQTAPSIIPGGPAGPPPGMPGMYMSNGSAPPTMPQQGLQMDLHFTGYPQTGTPGQFPPVGSPTGFPPQAYGTYSFNPQQNYPQNYLSMQFPPAPPHGHPPMGPPQLIPFGSPQANNNYNSQQSYPTLTRAPSLPGPGSPNGYTMMPPQQQNPPPPMVIVASQRLDPQASGLNNIIADIEKDYYGRQIVRLI